ncbi:serine kinase [Novosphingobium sp.]|uniref:HPr kinase/phosphorylase n=1 Tax=Novosphingobium sp. TaxID=1874826 RepID=UPI0033408314
MTDPAPTHGTAHQASAVAIGGRALMIEGAPGSGKSSLALALIDRGATLIGDDGVILWADGARLLVSPHPRIAGLLEVRNVGLITVPVAAAVPLALVLMFDTDAPRHIDVPELVERAGVAVPMVRLWPDSPVLALRAEIALAQFGKAMA